MKNPWLRIPAHEYEAHMSLPDVAQSQALSRLMGAALAEHAPTSLAVIGCATGNGFEHIDTMHTRRVVGVDINPTYLATLRDRFAGMIPNLELREADVATPGFSIPPVSMVFAGLVFEYLDVSRALQNIARSLEREATLLAVLQLPSTESRPVTATRYKSLELLEAIMNLVPPEDFCDLCGRVGLRQISTDTVPLKKGKSLLVGLYRKETPPDAAGDADEPGR